MTQLESALALLECLKEHNIHNRKALEAWLNRVDFRTKPHPESFDFAEPEPNPESEKLKVESVLGPPVDLEEDDSKILPRQIMHLSAPMKDIQQYLNDLIKELWLGEYYPGGTMGHCRGELERRCGVRRFNRASHEEVYREDAVMLIREALHELQHMGFDTSQVVLND
jgi:hypothetical protein